MNLPIPDPKAYAEAKPFPHLVLDDVFDQKELNWILLGWPKKHQHSIENKGQHLKSHTNGEKEMGYYMADFIMKHFQSQEFIGFLEKLTSIQGLVLDCFDPSLHETYPGGWLKPHLDYTISNRTGLQHRVNVILFLNEDWKPEYGGDMEIYESGKMHGMNWISEKNKVSISPIFNRIAIIEINENNSWHGASTVTGPFSRKSIAVNYFSLPDGNVKAQHTIFSNDWKARIKNLLK